MFVAMVKGAASTGIAAAVAVCGSWQVAKVFVPSSQAPSTSSSSNAAALRGADVAIAATATESFNAAVPLSLGFAGTVALAAAASSRSRASRCSLKATAAVEPEAATPPPPPPFDPAKQVGVTAPLQFFDPLGFSKVGDEAGFRKLRAAERKHGRVAMMAAVGAVTQHYVQFPGFQDVPKGLAAVTSTPGLVGMVLLTAACGALELLVWKESEKGEPGDFGNPLNLERMPGTFEPVEIGSGPRDRELNNGRMAMISILGIMGAELATGKDAVQQLL